MARNKQHNIHTQIIKGKKQDPHEINKQEVLKQFIKTLLW